MIAMDLMPGGSVAERVTEGAPADLLEALGWMRDTLGALDHAHGHGIVHRDVRSSNVLFDEVGHAMLTDFGVSEDSIRGLLVDGHDVYGPIAAPELASAATSKRSDVWAAGCLLYQLTTGHYPFADLAAAAAGKYEPAHRRNPQIPHAVTKVIATALAVDPGERFDDAGDMLQALAPQAVQQSWSHIEDPETIETWTTNGVHGPYTLTLWQLASGRYRVAVAAAPGRHLQERRRADFDTIGRARQQRRAWLLDVVGGRAL
jgi:serine/threonine-protein kinase